MSFRFYPRYVYGNPQRRVFLPNFWMKLVPNEIEKPSNFVQFIVPLEMTNRDIKNYLEKIYKVPVVHVRSQPRDAKLKKAQRGFLIKDGDDFRAAFVQLPVGTSFEFPDLFPAEKRKEELESHENAVKKEEKTIDEFTQKVHKYKDVPTWFT